MDTGTVSDADTGMPEDTADTVSGQDSGDTDPADGSDADTSGDTDVEGCGGQTCADDEVCRQDTCKPLDEVTCQEASDEGMLQAGSSLKIEGSFKSGSTDGLSTGCAGSDQAAEKVYSFTLADSSLIEVQTDWKGNFDAKVEFRRDTCAGASEEAKTCLDSDRTIWAAGGQTIYMVVENDVGEGGDFTIDLAATAAACQPDTYQCDGSNTVEYCQFENGGVNPTTYNCPDACSSGTCAGRSCSNPIEVTGSKTYTGTLEVYDAAMDFSQASNCTAGSPQPPSAGAEVVFRVSLNQGQTLSIDTSNDEANNVIFIAPDCKSDPTQLNCATATDDESVAQWTAPSSGTFYVIIDKQTVGSRDFEYAFDIK